MTESVPATFISYSRDDLKFVLQLAQDLKAAGANVWLDKLDIEPGQRWPIVVQEALTKCPRVLVVMSPSSVESPSVQDEVFFAVKERKKIIPVFYRECKVLYQLSSLQYADFRTDYALGLAELVRTLTSRKMTEQSAPARSEVPSGHRTNVRAADELEHTAEQQRQNANGERKQNARTTVDGEHKQAAEQELPVEQKRIAKPVRKEDSADDYAYDASVNALSGEIIQPFRQIIKAQGFLLLRGRGGFFSHGMRGYRLDGLVSYTSARTHVGGSASEEGWNTLANATVERLSLFDVVTADRVVAQLWIDRAREENRLPTVSFLGTTFENLRIGGRPLEVELETGRFEHGRISQQAVPSGSDKNDLQRPGTSHRCLVKTTSGSPPSGASRNSVALPGFGTLFLTELLADGDSYQLKMIRLVTQSGGEITVATCRAGIGLLGSEAGD